MEDWRILPQSSPSKDRFEEFLKEFKEYDRQYSIRKAQDEFLDAYSCWLKTHDSKYKLEAIRKGMKLEALDPSFSLQQIFPLKKSFSHKE